jgi:hypothetical protein
VENRVLAGVQCTLDPPLLDPEYWYQVMDEPRRLTLRGELALAVFLYAHLVH